MNIAPCKILVADDKAIPRMLLGTNPIENLDLSQGLK
jgi:hypothetical protein